MELTRVLRLLWDRRGLLVLGLIVGVVVSVATAYRVSLSPFGLAPRSTTFGAATTQVFVDSKRSTIATLSGNSSLLAGRSTLFAQFLTSQEVRDEINRQMGLPKDAIPVISSPNTVQQVESINLSKANQIAGAGGQGAFSITFQPQAELPIIDIFTRGPTAADAVKLANVAATSLSGQVARLSDASGVPENSPSRIVMRAIGPATGGQVANTVNAFRLVATVIGVFVAWCVLIVFFTWLRADWRRIERERTDVPAQ